MATAPRDPGRNDPCPCGSGRKFKRCHGGPAGGRGARAHWLAERFAREALGFVSSNADALTAVRRQMPLLTSGQLVRLLWLLEQRLHDAATQPWRQESGGTSSSRGAGTAGHA